MNHAEFEDAELFEDEDEAQEPTQMSNLEIANELSAIAQQQINLTTREQALRRVQAARAAVADSP